MVTVRSYSENPAKAGVLHEFSEIVIHVCESHLSRRLFARCQKFPHERWFGRSEFWVEI